MTETERRLEDVAAAVADAEAVDWAALDRSTHDPRDRAVIGHLRTLAGLAEQRRTPPSSASRPGERSRENPGFRRAVASLAGMQVAVGIAGYAWGRPDGHPVEPVLVASAVLAFGAAALTLVVAGGHDRRAVHLGLFFLLVAAAFAHRFAPWLAHVSPLFPFLSRWIHPDALMPWPLWLFVREFPRVVRFGRLDRLVRQGVRLSLVAGGALFLANLALGVAPSLTRPLAVLGRQTPGGFLYWAAVLGLCVSALAAAVARAGATAPDERRRVAFFMGGLAIGLAPMMVGVLLEIVWPPYDAWVSQPPIRRASAFVLFPFLLSIPATTAYSVLVDRVLDVRVVIRRTVRYLFARYTLIGLAMVPAAVLALHLYEQRDRTLAQILAGPRALALALAAAAALLALRLRRPVLHALDRLFQRERRLTDVLESVTRVARESQSPQALAEGVSDALRGGLGADSLLLAVRGEWLAPLAGTGRPLRRASALWAMLEADASPLNVDPTEERSAFGVLPGEDRLWVLDGGLSLVVPLVGAGPGPIGLLGAGRKASEAGYSRDERTLLAMVAASAALAIENRRMALGRGPAEAALTDSEEGGAQCPSCDRVHPAGTLQCPCGHATVAAPLPHVLLGKFRIEQMIGRGGMGVVYRATDLALGRPVAVKTLPRLAAEASLRMRREARAMAAVEHRNLAFILGAESWRGLPILVIEFLAGGTLTRRLRDGPLAPAETVDLGLALAGALGRLHAASLLHRDVKPNNIGFTADGTPKLLDFGLVRLVGAAEAPPRALLERMGSGADARETLTAANRLVGTPLYLSPEAIDGEPASTDFDLWSLALVLYESIAGRNPFRAPTVPEVLDRIRAFALPDLRQLRPDCPAALAEFFGAALGRRRDRRPRTAADFAERLVAAARG